MTVRFGCLSNVLSGFHCSSISFPLYILLFSVTHRSMSTHIDGKKQIMFVTDKKYVLEGKRVYLLNQNIHVSK